jgi:V-type H+-transporting ATPase subunit C
MFKFEVPSLMVGTLDSLMVSITIVHQNTEQCLSILQLTRALASAQTLGDELGKTDQVVDGVVHKIEKTGHELLGRKGGELTVGGVPAPRYVQQFAWDYAKYPNRRPLKELVSLIAGGVTAVDEELKQLATSYGEKQVALQEAQRKKGGNLMVADLNDVLTEDIMSKIETFDTEYLKTVFIAIPKSSKENFESGIEKLGSDLVGYGG